MNETGMEHRITKLEGETKEHERRIIEMEKRQDNLDTLVASVAAMANEQEHIKEDVSVIKTDVKALTDKPGKRWENIVNNIIWAVVAAVITFVLAKIGL